MKTLAAVLVEPNRVELSELEIPPLRPGQCLVRLAFSGICGTVLGQISGERGPDRYLPHLLGHEGSGTVLETGAGVSRVTVGDRVSLSWIAASGGMDAGGSTYTDSSGGQVNSGPVATLATHAVVSENRLWVLPRAMSLESAVLLGCAAPTGFGSILNVAEVGPGQCVAIWGAGGVGLMAVAAADYAGAASVVAIDPNERRLATAALVGATMTCTAGVAVSCDAAIVTTGSTAAMETALACVRPLGGRVVVVGNAPFGQRLDIDPGEFNQGKSLLGTWGGDSEPDRDNLLYARIIAASGASRVLSEPYRLENIQSALDDFAAGTICRPLIAMGA